MRSATDFAWAWAVCLLAFAAGCGSSSSDQNENFGKDVEGVYAIETWTKNQTSCESEGPDVAATEQKKKLGIRRDQFFVPFIVVAPCTDLDDCAAATGSSIFSGLFGGALLEKQVENGYSTDGTLSWVPSASGCTGALTDASLQKLEPGRVQFRTELHRFENVPFDTKDHDGNPDCSADNLRKVARAAACDQLEVISATHEADMPKSSN